MGSTSERGLMLHAASPARLVEGLRPERARDGLACPLHERLPQEFAARVAPVHPLLVATALHDRRDAGALLHRRRSREALTTLAERHQKPRSKRRPCAGQVAEELV